MTLPSQITVLVADDHAIVRQGLCALLKTDGQFVCVGQARTGREAVQKAAELKPDVILMDIAMPTLNGIEATRQILAANPAARVIVLSAHSDFPYVERMCEAGVAGFVEKQTSVEILSTAIREACRGNKYFSPTITKLIRDNPGKLRDRDGTPKPGANLLTAREAEVLQQVAEGAANKQIAAELGISIKTVEKHRQHLMDKLNIHDTAGLTRYAIKTGVIEGSVQLSVL
ncbi:MAG TPA: response regulator transcription factor [Opitutaceae bacterium]|nr:response regulator transcription factor [Opitutaceae bacterium]